MTTIDLGAEGEYGVRLARYLETHMDEPVRIRHFTHSQQWEAEDLCADLLILSRDFYQKLSGKLDLSGTDVIWISEKEEEEGYCMYHPPRELLDMIRIRLQESEDQEGALSGGSRIHLLFSPVSEPEMLHLAEKYMEDGDLYLGMGDFALPSDSLSREIYSDQQEISPRGVLGWQRAFACQDPDAEGSEIRPASMEELCYYIHLREGEILSRLKELARPAGGCLVLGDPSFFLPLLELTQEDYIWFFDRLKKSGTFPHIYVSIGCGMLGSGKILPHADRMILISSREDPVRHGCCESLLQSVQTGSGLFRGSVEIIYREDVLAYAE